ncbi:MAG: polysaccharide biosynthesis C-terminal domain-containing protein, partial [Clostridia bacterium]|nr:polysaccharide biosynthesis C-terminal domain-containing protein [Clostridia bacterium]
VFIYGYNAVSAIMRGMGDSKHPFIFIGVAAGLNVLLDILLVPRLGVGGAALATVVSQVVSVILCTVFLVRNRDKFSLICSFRDFIVWNVEMLVSLLKLGIPMAIKMAAVQISKLFVNSYVNSYGVEVSAFAGIANKLASFSNLISNSMNAAGSTMVGQNIAAEKYDRVKGIILRLAVITLTVSSIVSLAFIMFPEAIVGLFTGDGAVLALARPFVPIAVLLFFSSAMRAMMNALINGSGNYKTNFATAILDGIVLRIGLSVLFGLVLDMKHFGFWLGDALAGYTPFFIGLVFYLSGAWKKKID